MSKKLTNGNAPQVGETMTFELAVGELERVVAELENGRLSLSDALTHYEKGVFYLRHCYDLLENAEKKIAILSGTDAAGRPVIVPWTEEEATSLEEKARSRGRRRSADPVLEPPGGANGPAAFPQEDCIDGSDELF